jgi:hypothetical protein
MYKLHLDFFFPHKKKKILPGWKHGSGGRMPVQQVQDPEFKHQYQRGEKILPFHLNGIFIA